MLIIDTLKEKVRDWVKNKRIEQPDRFRSLILLVALLCLVWFARFFPTTHVPTYVPLSIAGQDHYLEVARAKQQQRQGLKNRAGLWKHGGMVFDLGLTRPVTVTMDEVNFPLTVFTLTGHLQILEVVHLQPKEQHTFARPCRYFVEIPRRSDIVPGIILEHFNPEATLDLDLVVLGSREAF
ncbi:MAG: DUF192 domain-containing protein [Acidobacteriota bacterium]|nr:DUF192 domain-containing protein [Acidobacteriota bacterium]